jgi:hypothetical protein
MTNRRDPIVEEVRKHREAIAREHGNRLDRILTALRREESSWPAGTISRPPKRIVKRVSRKSTRATRRPNKALEPTARR